MNRSYRHVWSAARGAYVIAAETARGRGKSANATRATRALAPALGAAVSFALAMAPPSQAQSLGAAPTSVVPTGGKANAYIAPNGVPVVNIEAANGAGISHNKYDRYDVESKGLVLNNAPLAKSTFIQSQLAGQVVGNLNMRESAKIILNEVVSTNRSTLAGYTEVLGGRADVIVVNPNGLTCTGCGFINTDRVTLTTGAPVWAQDGSLIGFNVSRGDIAIGGSGLNASAQQILDLVARSVSIAGQVNVAAKGSLGIYAGPNQWSWSGRNVAGTVAATGDKPAFAIDSTALGGMYAGRIRLVATEAGVGVRMLGDAAASADDFRLDAAGKVLVQSRVSAARDLHLAQTGARDAAQLEIAGANASLSAQHDLQLSADGGVALSDALLKAGNNLSVKADSLADRAAAGGNAARNATGSVDVAIAGAASVDGSTWGAGTHLALQAASLAVGATGSTLYSGGGASGTDRALTLATSGDLSIDKAKLTSTDTLALNAGGTLHLGAASELASAQDTQLQASAGIDNAASVIAGANLALEASALSNSGTLQAQKAIKAGAAKATAVDNAANARILADSVLLNATGVNNAGTVQATNGLELHASGKLANAKDGVLMSTAAGKDLSLSAAAFDNAGALQSSGGISATVAGDFANSGQIASTSARNGGADGAIGLRADNFTNSGTLAAAGAASLRLTGKLTNGGAIQGASLAIDAAKAVDNTGASAVLLSQSTATVATRDFGNKGTVQAGNALSVTAGGQLNNDSAIQTLDGNLLLSGATLTNMGVVQVAGDASLAATSGKLNNFNNVLVSGNLKVDAAGTMINSGAAAVMQAGRDFSGHAGEAVNGGAIQANANLLLSAGGSVTNTGLLQTAASGGALSVAGSALANSGVIQAADAAALTSLGGAINNSGQVRAERALALRASGDVANTGASALLAADTLSVSGVNLGNGATIQAGSSLQLTGSGGLSNSGVLQSRTSGSSLTARAATIANSGSIEAAGSAGLASTSGTISNNGQLQAADAIDLDGATGVANAGRVIGQQTVRIHGGNAFTVSNSGRIQAATALALGAPGSAASAASNSGTLFGDTVQLYASSFSNSGRVQSNGAGTISGASISNLTSSAVILLGMDGSASSLNATSSVYNAGAIHTAGDLAVSAARLDNTGTGGISSEAKLTMTAKGAGFDNAGALYAGTQLTVDAAGQLLNNNPTGTLDANDIVVKAATFNNYNTVISLHDTSITTTTAFNNLPTGRVPNIIIADTIYGTPNAIADWEDDCLPIVHTNCDHNITWSQRVTAIQGLDGDMPTQKGQIIAGNKLTINYGQSGVNTASLISAPNLSISGSGSFTNSDLHLERLEYERQWHMRKEGKVFSSDPYYWTYAASGGEFACNDGGCFTGTASSEDAAKDAAYRLLTDATIIKKWNAGIYADQLSFQGGALLNLGSAAKQDTKAPAATSAAGAESANPLAGTPLASAFNTIVNKLPTTAKTVAVQTTAPIQFKGLNLSLPTNPNGYFVTAKDPNSQYLVETNPLFGAGSNTVGSNYLTKLLNINPDQEIKRLGDANYEAKLVRDQLIAQTGNNILKGQKSEAAQMQALMDNASEEAGKLGLVYGKPLTPEQEAKLTEDMVWMVETVVGGQKVVAPVVYLAKSTRDAIENGGPVIAATNAKINAGTVTNTGGTIAGDKLDITAKGDITNTGGKIKGGDVSVTSTEGSIVNQTSAQTNGGKDFSRTVIGATGSIESTGKLNLDAAKDITVKGADVKAGGDASLAAGGNVSFDTIQDKRSDTVSRSSSGGFAGLEKSSSSTHTESVTNIGSNLESGGNLSIKSGGQTTLAGSQAKVGGDLALDAKGGVNIVSRQDTKETVTTSSHSGLGEGGGLYGSKETTTDNFQGRNLASGIDVKGNADIKTDGTLTMQGSKLKVGGSADIQANDVKVLAGQDVDRTTTTTTTTSFLKFDGAKGDSGAEAGAAAGVGVGSKAKQSIGAEASASANANGSAGVTLAETETRKTFDESRKSVGSELDIGGGLNVNSNKDITLQGAKVKSGGDTNLNAKGDVNILASQDTHVTSSTTTKTQIGLYADSSNKAEAGASATAGAVSGLQGKAEAGSDTTIDLARTSTTKSNSLDITNNGSTVDAGGKLNINAGNKLTVQGSDIGGDKGVSLKAKDQEFSAANDVHTESSTTTRSSIGFYVAGNASAEAGASATTGPVAGQGGMQMGVGMGTTANAGAEAKAGYGYQARTSTDSTSSGTTTAKVSSIRSGSGDIERTATGKITDVGTSIDAAGNFTQSATTIDSRAAQNTSYETSSSSSHEARVGVYAKAEASAGGAGKPEAGVSAGVEASYTNKESGSNSNSSQAVVSNIKAGGKVSSTSSGSTTLEGTNISGGGGVELSAKDIDFKAARDTESSSSSDRTIKAQANLGVSLSEHGVVDAGLGGGFDKSNENSSSSKAVTGSIQSGGGLTIKTQGDARFEGTDIAAKGDGSINAGGKLSMDAARNESSSSSKSSNFEASLSLSKSGGGGGGGGEMGAGLNASGGFDNEKSRSSEAVTGKVSSGGNLTLSSGSKATLEGTQLKSGGDTTVAAQSVEFKDAKSTSSSSSSNFSASLGLQGSSEGGEKSGGGVLSAQGGFTNENKTEAVKGSMDAGGKVQVKTGAAGIRAATAASAAADAKLAPAVVPAVVPVDAAPAIMVKPVSVAKPVDAAPAVLAAPAAVSKPVDVAPAIMVKPATPPQAAIAAPAPAVTLEAAPVRLAASTPAGIVAAPSVMAKAPSVALADTAPVPVKAAPAPAKAAAPAVKAPAKAPAKPKKKDEKTQPASADAVPASKG